MLQEGRRAYSAGADAHTHTHAHSHTHSYAHTSSTAITTWAQHVSRRHLLPRHRHLLQAPGSVWLWLRTRFVDGVLHDAR